MPIATPRPRRRARPAEVRTRATARVARKLRVEERRFERGRGRTAFPRTSAKSWPANGARHEVVAQHRAAHRRASRRSSPASGSAEHSPHPSASAVTTWTSNASLCVVTPRAVRNGRTSGSRTRMSSTARRGPGTSARAPCELTIGLSDAWRSSSPAPSWRAPSSQRPSWPVPSWRAPSSRPSSWPVPSWPAPCR